MKQIKCRSCKKSFYPPPFGRRPRYCSAACRQKAYRERAAALHQQALKALESDLYQIKDITARGKAAIKVLEELGYEVSIKRRHEPPPKKR